MTAKQTWIGSRTLSLLFSVISAGCLCAGFLNAQTSSGTFRTIDFPGAVTTAAQGINARGDIVGLYFLADGSGHGFLLRKDSFTSIDVPGAVFTAAIGIKSAGSIVGLYVGSDGITCHGFLLRKGAYSTIDFPGADGVSLPSLASGINDDGEITGQYYDASDLANCGSPAALSSHGFLLSEGTYTSFDPPGSIFTSAPKINSEGKIAGYYQSEDGKTHIYLRSADEDTFTTIDPPGPVSMFKVTAPGINARGQIAGYYQGTDGNNHGFVFTKGNFLTNDFPGAINTCNTDINSRGDVVGFYQTADGTFHGFLLTRGQPPWTEPEAAR